LSRGAEARYYEGIAASMKKTTLKQWYVEKTSRLLIREFVEKWHYSGSINGCIADYCYALYSPDQCMKGAMFFGRMAMRNQWKRFSQRESDVIELRRLCCVDDTPKNAESFFISRAIKLLSREWTGDIIVSYADKEFGHSGTIYKASNFTMLGEIKGAKVILYRGKYYHDKSIRTKYKGRLKPFAIRLKEALSDGSAVFKQTAGKFVYVYTIRRTKGQLNRLLGCKNGKK